MTVSECSECMDWVVQQVLLRGGAIAVGELIDLPREEQGLTRGQGERDLRVLVRQGRLERVVEDGRTTHYRTR